VIGGRPCSVFVIMEPSSRTTVNAAAVRRSETPTSAMANAESRRQDRGSKIGRRFRDSARLLLDLSLRGDGQSKRDGERQQKEKARHVASGLGRSGHPDRRHGGLRNARWLSLSHVPVRGAFGLCAVLRPLGLESHDVGVTAEVPTARQGRAAVALMNVFWVYGPIRDDPRFRALAKRAGVP
jgi:hypothetical protein